MQKAGCIGYMLARRSSTVSGEILIYAHEKRDGHISIEVRLSNKLPILITGDQTVEISRSRQKMVKHLKFCNLENKREELKDLGKSKKKGQGNTRNFQKKNAIGLKIKDARRTTSILEGGCKNVGIKYECNDEMTTCKIVKLQKLINQCSMTSTLQQM